MSIEPWTRSWRRRFLRPLLRTQITVNGQRFVLPYIGADTPFSRDYDDEPWFGKILRAAHSVSPGMFVDVGINVGQSLLMAKSIDPDWQYLGFEPSPTAWNVARELVRANELKKCTLVPLGLSDCNQTLRLFSNEATDASASLIDGFRDAATHQYSMSQIVGTCAFDEVLAKVDADGAVGVVKIDVEGGELEVMRGLATFLQRDSPVVVCEVLPVYDAATPNGVFRQNRQEELHRILGKCRYRIFRVLWPEALVEVEDFGVHGNRRWTNYVIVPEAKMEAFIAAVQAQSVFGRVDCLQPLSA